MNNRITKALAGFFLLFLLPFIGTAQNGNNTAYIIGPEVVCEGDCAIYQVEIDTLASTWQDTLIQWQVVDANIIGPADEKFVQICFGAPGTTIIQVLLLSPDGAVHTAAEFIVQVIPFTPLQITSLNPFTCDSLTGGINSLCEKVCPFTTVTYQAFSNQNPGGNPPIQGLQWFVNGAQSYTEDPQNGTITVTWGDSGSGSITAVTQGYCVDEASHCVTIIEEPVADIGTTPQGQTGDTIQICKGQTVYFDNLSTNADSYEWFLGDGSAPVNNFNTQHDYLSPGIYEVLLVAKSNCQCSDTARVWIDVLDADAPLPDCIGTICPGATVTYTTPAGCSDFYWEVGPNGTVLGGGGANDDNITIEWGSGPSGEIALFAQNCVGNTCPDTSVIRIPIIDDNAEIKGPEQVCPAAQEIYSIEPYQGTNFVWSLSGGGYIASGQGTNRVSVQWDLFSSNNTYELSVQYDNCYLGCGGADTIEVQIRPPFVINGPVEECENGSGLFTSKLSPGGQNLNANWTLYDPNGNVSTTTSGNSANFSFTDGPGSYRIFATPADPTQTCSNQADWAISVPQTPPGATGIEGTTIICPGEPLTYTATGLPPNANVLWTIQNGPGIPDSILGNPLVVDWNVAGPFELTIEQISNDGLNCVSDPLIINPGPFTPASAVFSGPDSVCLNGTTILTAQGVDGLPLEWSIPAGTGAIVGSKNGNTVEIFWSSPGVHSVTLEVCGQPALRPVTVLPDPNPTVNHPTALCSGGTDVISLSGSFATYDWLSESGASLGTTPTISLGPGYYSVEVSDAFGCSGKSEFAINTAPVPNISISTTDPTGFCNNSQTVNMQALVANGGSYDYQWFQDGNPVGSNSPYYSTNQYGNYTLVATNPQGCSASAGPILVFSDCGGGGGGGFPGGGPLCPAGDITFTSYGTATCDSFYFEMDLGPNYVAGSANWFFGQSGGALFGTAAGDNAGFNFPNAGGYIAAVQALHTNGSVCLIIDSVFVEAAAQFDTIPACAGAASQFTDISTFVPASNIVSWNWDFGDPPSGAANTSVNPNDVHTYSTGGPYQVSLTIEANSGCTSTETMQIDVPEVSPVAFSLPVTRCENTSLEFAVSPPAGITDLNWDFGDPASGAANNASGSPAYHSFPAGSYTVSLIVSDARGCTATSTEMLTTTPNTLAGQISPAAPPAFCEGGTITLTAPGGAGITYLWSDSTTTANTLLVDVEGLYDVTLTDADGCTYSPDEVNVDVTAGPDGLIKAVLENDLGQVIGTAYDALSVCDGEDVVLAAQGLGSNYSYQWSTGQVSSFITFRDEHGNLLPIGTHVFTVTITDQTTGCTSVSAPFTVEVNPVPSGFSINLSNTPACAGSSNVISYTGPNNANWQYVWNSGVQGQSLTTTQPGTYSLRVINEFGCAATSNNVTVLPGPNVAALPSGCHTRCRPDTLCLPAIPGIVSWQWYQDGNPIPGATDPELVATTSGSYWAELTDWWGCTATSEPLNLDLYDGFGNILGNVWSDVNHNGILDAADTLISDIPILLFENITQIDVDSSGASGDVAFTNLPNSNYQLVVDTMNLPPGWEAIITSASFTISGCDVLEQTDFLIDFTCQAAATNLNLSACPGDSVQYNGVWLHPGDNQNFILTTAAGCDSTVVVTVNPLASSTGALNVAVCPGSSYDYNGTLIPAGTSQSFTLTNFLGCDSVLTVNVGTLATSTNTLDVAACPGSTYDYNGTLIPAGQSQSFTLTNFLGCDSVLTVNVGTLATSTETLDVATCPGSTYDYNGTLIPAGQSQSFTLTNFLGCDSVLTVNVGTLATSTGTLDVAACPGSTYDYNGTLIPAGQSQSFTLTNFLGCDSVLTVNVGTLATSTGSLNVGACPGSTYDYNGTLIPAGQSQSFTLTNFLGCDSVLTVNVATLATTSETMNVSACPGTNYDYNGNLIPAGQTQSFTLTNYLGCDSTLTIVVDESPEYSEVVQVNVCPGTNFEFMGQQIPPGTTQTFQFQTHEGCDSTVTIEVLAYPDLSFDVATSISCPNTPTGSISLTNILGGAPPYQYSLDGLSFQSSPMFDPLSAGNYTAYVLDNNDCLFELDTFLSSSLALNVVLEDSELACDNPQVNLTPLIAGDQTDLQIQWSTGDTTISTTVYDSGPVWIEVSNQCEVVQQEAQVYWAAFPNQEIIYVPNVFKPASNLPENHHFRAYFPAGLQVISYEMQVFDRWGDKLFITNTIENGWPGPFRSEDMQPAVFVWLVEAEVQFCGQTRKISLKGDVTIVR